MLELIVISLIDHIDRLERDSFWVLFFQIVWEVPVEDIREHGLRLLGVVGVEWHAFNHEAVSEEEDRHFIVHFEAFDARSDSLEALFFGDKIELLNSPLKNFCIDFTGDI